MFRKNQKTKTKILKTLNINEVDIPSDHGTLGIIKGARAHHTECHSQICFFFFVFNFCFNFFRFLFQIFHHIGQSKSWQLSSGNLLSKISKKASQSNSADSLINSQCLAEKKKHSNITFTNLTQFRISR